jgi:hypothetical protein
MPLGVAPRYNLVLTPIDSRRTRRAGSASMSGLIELLENRLLLSATPTAHHSAAASHRAARVAMIPTPALSVGAGSSVVTQTSTTPIPGDANLDGRVDATDFAILSANYGMTTGATWAQGDFDGDGAVNFTDFMILTQHYLQGVGGINPVSAQAPAGTVWQSPLVITKGGTYTGNWQSLSPNTPAVTIETSQPVTILNSNIQSRGTLIESSTPHANITVEGTSGWGLNPNIYGTSPGRFLDASNFNNIDVENNSMAGTSGMELGYYAGNGTASQTITVEYNNALNIDGRYSNGAGGFLTGPNDNDYVQFVQLNACNNLSGVQIAWNQVVNQPGLSRVEDNISIYESSGTSASPILIHDNNINGAFPASPATDTTYSGGGIMLSDGATGSAATDPGYVQAYNNIVTATTNYGIAISSGHDDLITNNIVIASGLLPNGTKIASQNVGIYIMNLANDSLFKNNQSYGNTIGWMGPSGRNDAYYPDASGPTNDDTHLAGAITLAIEASYFSSWAQRVSQTSFSIGA